MTEDVLAEVTDSTVKVGWGHAGSEMYAIGSTMPGWRYLAVYVNVLNLQHSRR